MGSSPRVRGTGVRLDARGRRNGIIPARAGNRRGSRRSRAGCRDHPRACGEQGLAAKQVGIHLGSSPRVRGTAAITRNRRCRLGIIPARAGNSFTVSAISASVRDHPRACGEQVALADDVGEEEGSSPRVRGTADNARAAVHGIGIIPARAGNSRLMHHNSSSDTGSSPRVRGTGAVAVMERVVDGIIPARAGNRRRSIEPISAIRDHPRACGEQSCRCPLPVRGAGSSPRVRGTVFPPVREDVV